MKDDLHKLIHSLSQSEKRYFRLFAGNQAHGEGSIPLTLFDVLISMPEYSESEAKIQAAPDVPPERFAHAKHYLKNLILRSLESFHYQKSPRQAVHSHLNQLEILEEKGLWGLAEKTLRKSLKTALKNDLTDILPQLRQWEQKIAKKLSSGLSQSQIDTFKGRASESMSDLSVNIRLRLLYEGTMLILSRDRRLEHPENQEKVRTFLEKLKPFQQNPPEAFHSKHYLLLTSANLAHLQGDFIQEEQHYAALFRHWREHPHQIQQTPEQFIRISGLWLNSVFLSGKGPEMLPQVQALRRTPGLTPNTRAELYNLTYNLEIVIHLNHDQLAKAKALLPEVLAFFSRQEKNINRGGKTSLFFNLGTLFFKMSNWQTSLEWFIRHGKVVGPTRADHQRAAMILPMILQYECGLTPEWERAHRNLGSHLTHLYPEWQLGQFFHHLFKKLKQTRPSEKTALFQQALNEFQQFLPPDQPGPIAGDLYLQWLQMHANL